MDTTQRSLHFSHEFAISCGTVTLDPARSKLLLIRHRATGEHYLPKGRKNIAESLEETALRETREETGVQAQLLPVPIETRSTWDGPLAAVARPREVTEPLAVTQRVANGVLKIIFWFVAVADSTVAVAERPQEDHEQFETVWADYDSIDGRLTFDDDRRVAQTAMRAAARSGKATPSTLK